MSNSLLLSETSTSRLSKSLIDGGERRYFWSSKELLPPLVFQFLQCFLHRVMGFQREYTRRPDRSEQNWRWRGFDPAKPRDREEIEASGMLESESREDPTTTEPLWCNARMQNALERDFTVNALMYDPFSRIVFDYTNGIKDCR